jgi:hypothetical protein
MDYYNVTGQWDGPEGPLDHDAIIDAFPKGNSAAVFVDANGATTVVVTISADDFASAVAKFDRYLGMAEIEAATSVEAILTGDFDRRNDNVGGGA